MKKLKSLLIIMLCFCLTSLVACGKKPPEKKDSTPPTTTTITLAEAEEIIVDALAIENGAAPVSFVSDTSDYGNRNVFKKMENFKINIAGTFEDTEYYQNYNGQFKYENDKYTKVILESDVLSVGNTESQQLNGYSSNGNNLYTYNQSTNEKVSYNDYETGIRSSLFNEVNSYVFMCELLFTNVLFSDMSFGHLYNSDLVTKTTNENGFSITLDIDVCAFGYIFEGTRWGEPFEFDEQEFQAYCAMVEEFGEEYLISITNFKINFNNSNEIESIIWTFNNKESFSGNQYIQTHYNVKLEKLSTEISAPDWFDESDYV